MNAIGELLIKTRDFNGAITYFSKAISLADELNLRDELVIMYKNALMSYAALENFDSAQIYLNLYNTARSDSLWKEYRETEELNTLAAGKTEVSKSIKRITYTISGVFAVLLIVLVWLFLNMKKARQKVKELSEKDN